MYDVLGEFIHQICHKTLGLIMIHKEEDLGVLWPE